jgi:hypothetical protein
MSVLKRMPRGISEERRYAPHRHLGIGSHQLGVNVVLFDIISLQRLDDLRTVMQHRMDNGARCEGDDEHVRHHERGGDVERRVLEVRGRIELVVHSNDARVVVGSAEAIVGTGREDGHVFKVPDLRRKSATED